MPPGACAWAATPDTAIPDLEIERWYGDGKTAGADRSGMGESGFYQISKLVRVAGSLPISL